MDYTGFIVANCPDTVIYIPNFITNDEEEQIMQQIEHAPKPKWTQLTNRRLINYGGIPHKNGMIAEQIPKWLQGYIDKINNLGLFDKNANHCLVNEYLSGQGIMPHLDGSLFHPTIATISCGSHTILNFHKYAMDDDHRLTTTTTTTTNDDTSMIKPVQYESFDESSTSSSLLPMNDHQSQINDDDDVVDKFVTEPSSSPTSKNSSSSSAASTSNSNGYKNGNNGSGAAAGAAQQRSKQNNNNNKYICRLLIEPKSLLILKDDMYHKYMHSISEADEDYVCDYISNLKYCGNAYKLGDVLKRNKRISLTIRHVPKTSKMKLGI